MNGYNKRTNIRKLLKFCLFVLMIHWGCQDVTVGYLDVKNAAYNPDSLIVRTRLDSTGVDRQRVKTGQPWMSLPIEGVEGTKPIFFSIRDIITRDGDKSSMQEALSVRNDGTFMIPLDHKIQPGHCLISLDFENEGYRKFKDVVFTIIVKE